MTVSLKFTLTGLQRDAVLSTAVVMKHAITFEQGDTFMVTLNGGHPGHAFDFGMHVHRAYMQLTGGQSMKESFRAITLREE